MLQPIVVAVLATLAVGGIAYVLIYPLLSGERRVEARTREIALADLETRRARRGADAATSRRQQIEETLKQVEERQRSRKRPPLAARLQQAGVPWSKRQYWIASGMLGTVATGIPLVLGQHWYIALGIGFAAAFGVPRWLLAYLKKQRQEKFITELPNAIDVIVRGVKSGLPLGDCIRIIAAEAREPLRSEFRTVAESTAVGMSLGEACAKLYDRVPLPETNFFAIVIAIQQRAGGNLAEALSNLSRVLRERKKMRAKIKAMSMEAKASAAIIASLPIAVMILVYLTSPRYIELLWITPTGRMMLAASAVWMLTGTLVMRRMINFDI